MKSNIKRFAVCLIACIMPLTACDTSSLEADIAGLELRLAAIEDAVEQANSNAIAAHRLLAGSNVIVGYTATEEGYIFELGDGDVITVTFGAKNDIPVPVIGIDSDGNWIMSFDGSSWEKVSGSVNAFQEGATPSLRTDPDGWWEVSTDGGKTWQRVTDADGNPLNALNGGTGKTPPAFFEDIVTDPDGGTITFIFLTGEKLVCAYEDQFSLKVLGYREGQVILLNEQMVFPVEANDVSDAIITVPDGWNATLSGTELQVHGPATGTAGSYSVTILLVSSKHYLKKEELVFTLNPITFDEAACKEWNDFNAGNDANVLLDYSYAGYMHGEVAPPDVYSLGYKVYDVTDYGAIPDDGKSDREAFLKVLEEIMGTPTISNNSISFPNKPSAKAIVYFPEGEFILHTADDDVVVDGKRTSRGIIIRAGEFVLKGAGRGKTTITMQDPCQPTDQAVMYSSPDMLLITHWTSFTSQSNWAVTADAAKGSFSVELPGHTLKEGDWVCLNIVSKDTDLLKEELYPYYDAAMSYSGGEWSIIKDGVEVNDYHEVKAVDGSTVTFCEPIMHEVKAKYGWKVYKYPNHTKVGVEDITFKGNAKEHFVHHGSWEDDGAYKPISMTRLTHSWLRRCEFQSTSEACSVTNSANVSVYDIRFTGRRGHASIRSAGSSRVFIGATFDHTSGDIISGGTWMKDAGNYHAVGVSKPSMGAVLWRNTWGDDSCFESHASQPRATLFDCCAGGFMRYRMGGDANELPNHLADLTLWNFNATSGNLGGQAGNDYSNWIWWGGNDRTYWTTLQPIIIGFHGALSVNFPEGEGGSLHVGSNGTAVYPESLYEAQLRRRLGFVPGWLNTLKTIE
ncbi:MAG: DUF4955 domain-containing protein [Clostridium sp.]|nr:DUF4955 domain-containing protein [Bacteroides sp.]MCM1198607.1 DUF4955 domain-containing protein [Clostridium sp.]